MRQRQMTASRDRLGPHDARPRVALQKNGPPAVFPVPIQTREEEGYRCAPKPTPAPAGDHLRISGFRNPNSKKFVARDVAILQPPLRVNSCYDHSCALAIVDPEAQPPKKKKRENKLKW